MPRRLLDRIRNAVAAADTEALKACAYEIDQRQLGKDTFAPRSLKMILTLLAEPDVLALQDAWPILAPLDFDADKLTAAQRRRVVKALERAYPRFVDRTAQFYITEFVGRKFADQNALWLFFELAKLKDDRARALVAHGLEHVVCSGDVAIAAQAFEKLKALAAESSTEVASEALLSLARVVQHGGAFAADAATLLLDCRQADGTQHHAGMPDADPTDGIADFDFLIGNWSVRHRRLKRRLAGETEWIEFTGPASVQKFLDGFGNRDEIRIDLPEGSYVGSTIRLYNPRTSDWSIYWMDSRDPKMDPPMIGRFGHGRGLFFGEDMLDGRPIRIRFIWTPISMTECRWEQAFSPDGGETWETNWIMSFTRVQA
ncbi:MAG TPA: hypothetical protein VG323_11805 [Thermoanaerobaculia bacterium]|nr:hypothetical protein [Thermoanaerobaculia bacterium]